MNDIPFPPAPGYVLVEPVADWEQKTTAGGIVLPDTRKPGEARLSCGRVVAVWLGKMAEIGRRVAPWPQDGWCVLHTTHGAHTLYGVGGRKYLLVDQDEVVARLDPVPEGK